MRWIEIKEQRPPHGELIWVWDTSDQKKCLIRYNGSEESWLSYKDKNNVPIWAFLNDISTGE